MEKGLAQLLYTFSFSYSQVLGVTDWCWWLQSSVSLSYRLKLYVLHNFLHFMILAFLVNQPPISNSQNLEKLQQKVYNLFTRRGIAHTHTQSPFWVELYYSEMSMQILSNYYCKLNDEAKKQYSDKLKMIDDAKDGKEVIGHKCFCRVDELAWCKLCRSL